MSSKKILIRVRVDEELREKFLKEADTDCRKPGSMMERILRERYKLPGGEQGVENGRQGR